MTQEQSLNEQSIEIFGSRITPGTATIISIWPSEMVESVPHAGRVIYRLPAGERDKVKGVVMNAQRLTIHAPNPADPDYFVVPERPCKEGELGYSFLTCVDTNQFSFDHQRGEVVPLPCRAKDAAEGLLSMWSKVGTRAQTGRAGFRLLTPSMPLEELVKEMYREQAALFREMIIEADTLYASERFNEITDAHRRGAKWMGEEPVWAKVTQVVAKKACLLCANQIPAAALKCPTCQEFLPQAYEQYGIDYSGDHAVAAFLAKRKSTTGPKAPLGAQKAVTALTA